MKSCDILLIEDDPAIRSLIRTTLDELGLKLMDEGDGSQGEARARDYLPTVILLDLGLPNRSGLEILAQLKSWYQGSVIVITAWQDEESKLKAFDLGADDYISKPFSPRELLARVRVAIKRVAARNGPQGATSKTVGHLQIDWKEGLVRTPDQTALTQTECKFILALAKEPGALVSQTRLLRDIWGPNHVEDTHYLRILVSRLRRKLPAELSGIQILTEAGLGYRLIVAEIN